MDLIKFQDAVNDISNSGDEFSKCMVKNIFCFLDRLSEKDKVIEEKKLIIQKLKDKIEKIEVENTQEIEHTRHKYLLIVECENLGKNEFGAIFIEFANNKIFETCYSASFENIRNQIQVTIHENYPSWNIIGKIKFDGPVFNIGVDLFITHTD